MSNSQGQKTKGEKGCKRKTPTKPPNSAFLNELATIFAEDDEATSPEFTSALADIALKRWGKKLKPNKLKSILDKYNLPANCASMTGKTCNPETLTECTTNCPQGCFCNSTFAILLQFQMPKLLATLGKVS